jgi:glyoxylase-like metal-dependent hydrolase (beta-lactamase superfamily II)
MQPDKAIFAPLAHGIYCIDALYVKPQVASIYLLREGDEAAIIETGTFHSIDNVLATLRQLGIDRSQVKYVIPTHVHLDHAGGAGEMMRRFEQAQLIVHPLGARHMIDPSRLVAGTIGVYGQQRFEALYGSIEPIDEARVIVAEDMSRHSVGGRELVFIDTPGHARHHFCIYDRQSEGVFTGDTFGISYQPMKSLPRGLLPTTPPNQFDPEALRRSIDRIMSFAPKRLYLTHYGEFLDPGAQLASFDRWIEQYVEISRGFDRDAADFEDSLQQALTDEILNTLAADGAADLHAILRNDITLNAQGLAHWRRREADA